MVLRSKRIVFTVSRISIHAYTIIHAIQANIAEEYDIAVDLDLDLDLEL